MKNNAQDMSLLIKKGSGVLCAVSGGADSMCMLHMLHSSSEQLGIKVYAAHYEHGIRGEESLRDCRFVEEYCETHGIILTVEHGDIPDAAARMGLGTEETARILRYEFLEKSARELGCDYIATAHNADDNAETILFNLTRGAGAAGLRGIPQKRGKIIRPVLHMTRDEIEQYLKINDVPHIEDSSNSSDDYTRNIIRHKVTPVLKTINPNFAHAAANTSELMRRDNEFMDAIASEFIERSCKDRSIPLNDFNSLHPSIAGRVIRMMCPASISMEQSDRVIQMAAKGEKAHADLPGIRITVERGKICFGSEQCREIGQYVLETGKTVIIPEAGMTITAEVCTFSKEINNSFKTYMIKYENIYGDVVVTGRKAADKMRPIGRKCTKTLKSLFLERKMTEKEKDMTPVIRDDKGILVLVGMAVDERCRSAEGDKVLKIEIGKLEHNC